VESSGSTDRVVSGSSHHWGSNGGLCLIFVILVRGVAPDPERTGVVWAFIGSDNKLFAYRVVSLQSLGAGIVQSPLECLLVDVATSVALLVQGVEVGIHISGSGLHRLSRHQLGLHLVSANWVFTRVKHVKAVVEVLGDRYRIQGALGLAVTLIIDLWEMDWGDSVDLVEIIYGLDVGIKGGEITSHSFLGVDGPWGALAALGVVGVDEFRIVACWFQGIAALEFKTSDHWL